MEWMFFVEPAATTTLILGSFGLILAIVAFCIGIFGPLDSKMSEKESILYKNLKKYGVIFTTIFLFLLPIANILSEPFEIYKKVLIYKGVESETADKLVENINSLLDLTNAKIKEFTPAEKE